MNPPGSPQFQLPSFRDGFVGGGMQQRPNGSGYAPDIQYDFPAHSMDTHQRTHAPHVPHNFGHAQPNASGSSFPAAEPTCIPLPDDENDDFPSPHLLLGRMARPASKVAGVRRSEPKGKGKQKAIDLPVPSGSGSQKRKLSTPTPQCADVKKPRGRATGAANYVSEDLDGLFDILEEHLPLGGKAWNSAADDYNQWAEENGRPAHTTKSLELKFKQLVKTSKPTGNAECPPHIQRAHEIEMLMSEKAGSRDLDDEDIVDASDAIIITSNEEDVKQVNVKVKVEKPRVPIARRPPADCIATQNTARNTSQDLLATITNVLDPDTRRARNEEHSVNALQTGQIFTLTSQLREAQRVADDLRNQLMEADRQRNASERRADRAELLEMMTERRGAQVVSRKDLSPGFAPRVGSRRHSKVHSQPRKCLYRQEITYAGGGKSVRWIGGSDDNQDEVQGFKDSPGTRRITYYDDDDSDNSVDPIRKPHRHRDVSPLTIQPPTPYNPPASGFDNSQSSGNLAVGGGFDAVVTPQLQPRVGISLTVSPHCHYADDLTTRARAED
ncbi:uncharacterized protein LACBIDRAFT_316771 [Laccaria bicolor S238N-H82]|uniref:Predicted protein n=1 Tax=Laccaria bicolor (strain S238N-H82 / ATCC MYA-4686) TaxID=486041 RepID=B0DZ86_LACBS|nr:uncharacterized protein LACBIDRAFT_314787 [Laccaria bicolor S238N-H82]XP_001890093.1 uncharacterized protein LACBIDRAFT_316771 [Laccaria bicolor S238N-H82]EDQ99283.1 predicted protein [Laccaria bicolor S238N-H82]EDR00046.1 predicted protein [Laccaria bicolor S238N-H82]|eukprot:XP_001889252.1 predicted protein [Laccaria bicolor S238N-H82]